MNRQWSDLATTRIAGTHIVEWELPKSMTSLLPVGSPISHSLLVVCPYALHAPMLLKEYGASVRLGWSSDGIGSPLRPCSTAARTARSAEPGPPLTPFAM